MSKEVFSAKFSWHWNWICLVVRITQLPDSRNNYIDISKCWVRALGSKNKWKRKCISRWLWSSAATGPNSAHPCPQYSTWSSRWPPSIFMEQNKPTVCQNILALVHHNKQTVCKKIHKKETKTSSILFRWTKKVWGLELAPESRPSLLLIVTVAVRSVVMTCWL